MIFQRDVSDDPEADAARIDALMACASAEHDVRLRLRCEGELADLLRRTGRYEEAVGAARHAVATAAVLGDDRSEAANGVRLATALQYADRHVEALDVFAAELAREEAGFVEYRHFALQHLGKCLVEVGDHARAAGVLGSALELRRELGHLVYVESTQRALDALAQLDPHVAVGGD